MVAGTKSEHHEIINVEEDIRGTKCDLILTFGAFHSKSALLSAHYVIFNS